MNNPECSYCGVEMKELYIGVTDYENDISEDAFAGYECPICKAQFSPNGNEMREPGNIATEIWDEDCGWRWYCEMCKHHTTIKKDLPCRCDNCGCEIIGVLRV